MQSYDPRFPVRRLNRLARELNCRSYLEIGVNTGVTLMNVAVEQRTGVDPCFGFNWEEVDGKDGVDLHACTSDDFFIGLDESIQYDLILIDGLHTFEQTYRDILNAIKHSHSRTVIAVDDTIPCDVFSTCRSMEEALMMRREITDSNNPRWHGDTYRVIPLLTLFNPNLSLLTLIDNGNPWSLLWRPGIPTLRREHEMLQALEAIQNLAAADYLWLVRNLNLFSPVGEDEGISIVIESIRA